MATKKKWSAKVDTDSTHPDEGLFNKDPATIAKSLASKKVSPKGAGSGMRMLTFYINRAGKNLPKERRTALEKAKSLLSGIISKQKEKDRAEQREKDGKEKPAPRKTRKAAAKKAAKKSGTKSASRTAKSTRTHSNKTAKKAA